MVHAPSASYDPASTAPTGRLRKRGSRVDENSLFASRRRLLAAGLGSAAAAALSAARPLGVAALSAPMLTETDNATGATTSITNSDATSGAIGLKGSAADAGTGLFGSALTGVGVLGQSTTGGAGVRGTTTSGVGVDASAAASGYALRASGRVKFSRSGRFAISAGHSSRTITYAGVTTTSLIIATLQTRHSGLYILAAVPGSGKFTVYLNKSVSSSTNVAYFIIN